MIGFFYLIKILVIFGLLEEFIVYKIYEIVSWEIFFNFSNFLEKDIYFEYIL